MLLIELMMVSSDLRMEFFDHHRPYPKLIRLFLERLQGLHNRRLPRPQHQEHILHLHRRLLCPMRLLEILPCQILLHFRLQAVMD